MTRTQWKIRLCSAGSAVILSMAASAHAQSANVGTPGTAATSTLEEVVVTAEKRSELASRTPVAPSAVSGETLRSEGVIAISDLQNTVPSLTVGRDPFGVNLNIRGVTTTDNTSKGDQGIGFNIDGVPIGRPIAQGLAFFDVQRVEVLRGPQGTLYGKSTTGGAINVITNKPGKEFDAALDTEFGNYSTWRGNAMLNVPVNDFLSLRFAGNFNQREGFLEPSDGSEARNGQHDVAARVSALMTFTPDVSLLAQITVGQVGGVGPSSGILSRVLDGSGDEQRRVFGNPFGSKLDDQFVNGNVELNVGLGFANMTYIGARQRFLAHDLTSSTNDPAGNYNGPPPIVPTYAWRDYRGTFVTDSHEVRFSNAEPSRLDWVVGANWYKEDIKESDHNWNAPVTNPTLAGSTNGIDPLNNTIHTTYGFFGQGTFHVTEQLGVVLGVRQGTDEVERRGTFAAGPGPWLDRQGRPCVAPNDCVGGPNNGNQSADKLTYRVGLNYQITPDNLLYGSVATGYKAGGFNDFDPATGGVAPYEPEDLLAYEIGFKGRLLPNLRLNTSVFYYDYKKNQISSLVNIAGNFVIYTRAAPTTIYGMENEATWQATPNDQFTASLVLLQSEYKEFRAGIFRDVNWSGQSLDKTPEVVVTAGYSHTWDLADGASLMFRAYTKYSSDYLISSISDAARFRQDAFTRTDASLRYETAERRFWTELFVRNIEDNVQALGGVGSYKPNLPLAATTAVSEPRYFGLRIGVAY